MLRNIQNINLKALLRDNGFTFMEVVTVILVIGVLTGAVGISIENVNSKVRLSNATARALADIKELKEKALNEGKSVSITVNPGANSYTLNVDTTTETVYFNQGDYRGVTISSTSFSGPLVFDMTGQPTDNGGDFAGERIFMNINDGDAEIQVWGRSGLVTVNMYGMQEGCGCSGGC